jgi:hypothetical protein
MIELKHQIIPIIFFIQFFYLQPNSKLLNPLFEEAQPIFYFYLKSSFSMLVNEEDRMGKHLLKFLLVLI